MTKKKPQNCWDFWNCTKEVREQCPAYKSDSGGDCWFVAGYSEPKIKKCQKLIDQFKTCFECPWFKKLNPKFDKEKELG